MRARRIIAAAVLPTPLVLVAAGCASAAQGALDGHRASEPGHGVLIVAAGQPCLSTQPDIQPMVAQNARQAAKHLKHLGFPEPRVLHEATIERVRSELGADQSGPLTVLYMGHGALTLEGDEPRADRALSQCPEHGPRCVSHVCLADGSLAVDELARAVPKATPFAFLVIDACTSAHVDPRGAQTNVSVMSASPVQIDMSVRAQTLLTEGLLRLSREALDLDCDGAVSDLEWFRAWSNATSQGTYALAQPKLRRQAAGPQTMMTVAHERCMPRSRPGVVDADARAAEEFAPAQFRVLGPLGVGEDLVVDGTRHAAGHLVPMACEHAIGQCFRLDEVGR